MYLQELTDYKSKILKLLCSSQSVVDLILGTENSKIPNRNLIDSQIFPYCHVPNVTTEKKTYVCFDVDAPRVKNYSIFKDMEVYVYIFTHQDLLKSENGLVTDLIACEIDQLLNGNDDVGGITRLSLVSSKRFTPAEGYHGRVLTYANTSFNRDGTPS